MTGEDKLNRIADRLENWRRSGDGYTARCPSHDDSHPSLSVKLDESNGRVVMCCGAGCPIEDVLEAIGLSLADVAPDSATRGQGAARRSILRRHEYHDASGSVIAVKLRHKGGGSKFSWLGQSGEPGLNGLELPLFRLPFILEANRRGQDICITEGERDAESLLALGLVATSPPHGARAEWRSEWSASIAGARVTIIADRDDVGVRHALRVRSAVTEAACTVVSVLVPRPPWRDVTDLLESGGELADLVDISEYQAPTGKEMVTRDGRPAFAMPPHFWITDLDPICLKIASYVDVLRCFYGQPPEGRNRLATALGLSPRIFTEHVGHLADAGILRVTTHGQKMVTYEVVNPSRPKTTRSASGSSGDPPVGPQVTQLEGDSRSVGDPLPISSLSPHPLSSRGTEGEGDTVARLVRVFPGAEVSS